MSLGLKMGFVSGHGKTTPTSTTFDFQVQTTAASEVFTIPCQNSGVFNATIDWGDGGATSAITTYNDVDLAHTYATAGTYNITISGTFPNIHFFSDSANAAKVKKVTNLGTVGWTTLNLAFYGCSNMTSFVSGTTDTSSVVDFGAAFSGCTGLTTLDVSGFNTSSAQYMGSLFNNCVSVSSIDVSGFNTANVTDMAQMFYNCNGLTTLNVTSFNTSKVATMNQMFYAVNGISSLDVTGFNTSSATNISGMFQSCTASDINPSGFDISNVTNMTNFMFGSGMTTANYDASLIYWDGLTTPPSGLSPNFGTSTYTLGGAAATARADLVSTHLWTITDGGGV